MYPFELGVGPTSLYSKICLRRGHRGLYHNALLVRLHIRGGFHFNDASWNVLEYTEIMVSRDTKRGSSQSTYIHTVWVCSTDGLTKIFVEVRTYRQ